MRTKREQAVFFKFKRKRKKEILLWKLRFLKTFYEIESRLIVMTMLSIKLLNFYSFGLSRVK